MKIVASLKKALDSLQIKINNQTTLANFNQNAISNCINALLDKINNKHQSALDARTQVISELYQEIIKCVDTQSLEGINERINALIPDEASRDENIIRMLRHLVDLKKQLLDSNLNLRTNQLNDLKSQLQQELQQKQEDLTARLDELGIQHANKLRMFDELSHLGDRMPEEALAERLTRGLRNNLQQLNQWCQELEENCKAIQSRMDNVRQEANQARAQSESSQRDLEQAQQLVNNAREQLAMCTEEVEGKKRENEEAKRQITDKAAALKTLQRKQSQFIEDLKKNEQNIARLDEEISKQQKASSDLTQKLDEAIRKQEVSRLNNEREKERYQANQQELTNKLKNNRTKQQRHTELATKAERSAEDLAKQVADLERQSSALSEEIDGLKRRQQQTQTKTEEEARELTAQLFELENNIQQKQRSLRDNQAQLNKLESEVTALATNLSETEQLIGQIEATIKRQEELAHSKQAVAELDEKREAIKQNVAQLKVQQELSEQLAKQQKAQKQLDEIEAQHQSVDEDCKRTGDDLTSCRNNQQPNLDKLSEFKQELEDAERKIKQLTDANASSQLSDKIAKLERLSKAKEQLQQDITSNEEKLNKQKQDLLDVAEKQHNADTKTGIHKPSDPSILGELDEFCGKGGQSYIIKLLCNQFPEDQAPQILKAFRLTSSNQSDKRKLSNVLESIQAASNCYFDLGQSVAELKAVFNNQNRLTDNERKVLEENQERFNQMKGPTAQEVLQWIPTTFEKQLNILKQKIKKYNEDNNLSGSQAISLEDVNQDQSYDSMFQAVNRHIEKLKKSLGIQSLETLEIIRLKQDIKMLTLFVNRIWPALLSSTKYGRPFIQSGLKEDIKKFIATWSFIVLQEWPTTTLEAYAKSVQAQLTTFLLYIIKYVIKIGLMDKQYGLFLIPLQDKIKEIVNSLYSYISEQAKSIQSAKSIEEVEDNYQRLQQAISGLNFDIMKKAFLKEDSARLVSQLEAAHSKLEEDKQVLPALESKITQLQEDVNTFKVQAQQELSDAKAQRKELSEAINEKQQEVAADERAIAALSNILQDKQKELTELAAKRKTQSDEVSEITSKIAQLKQQLAKGPQINQSEESLSNALRVIEEKIADQNADIDQIEQELGSLANQEQQSRKQLQEAQNSQKQLQEQQNQRLETISELKTANTNLELELEQLQDELNKQKLQQQSAKESGDDTKRQVSEKIKAKEAELTQKATELGVLKNKQQVELASQQQNEKEVADLKTEYIRLEAENRQNYTDYDDQQRRFAIKTSTQQATIDRLQREQEAANQEKTNAEDSKRELEKQASEQRQQLQSINDDVAKAKQELDAIEQQQKDTDEQIEALTQQQRQFRAKYDELKHTCEAKQHKHNEVANHNDAVIQKCQQEQQILDNSQAQLRQQQEALEQKKQEWSNQIDDALRAYENSKAEYYQKQREFEAGTQDFDGKLSAQQARKPDLAYSKTRTLLHRIKNGRVQALSEDQEKLLTINDILDAEVNNIKQLLVVRRSVGLHEHNNVDVDTQLQHQQQGVNTWNQYQDGEQAFSARILSCIENENFTKEQLKKWQIPSLNDNIFVYRIPNTEKIAARIFVWDKANFDLLFTSVFSNNAKVRIVGWDAKTLEEKMIAINSAITNGVDIVDSELYQLGFSVSNTPEENYRIILELESKQGSIPWCSDAFISKLKNIVLLEVSPESCTAIEQRILLDHMRQASEAIKTCITYPMLAKIAIKQGGSMLSEQHRAAVCKILASDNEEAYSSLLKKELNNDHLASTLLGLFSRLKRDNCNVNWELMEYIATPNENTLREIVERCAEQQNDDNEFIKSLTSSVLQDMEKVLDQQTAKVIIDSLKARVEALNEALDASNQQKLLQLIEDLEAQRLEFLSAEDNSSVQNLIKKLKPLLSNKQEFNLEPAKTMLATLFITMKHYLAKAEYSLEKSVVPVILNVEYNRLKLNDIQIPQKQSVANRQDEYLPSSTSSLASSTDSLSTSSLASSTTSSTASSLASSTASSTASSISTFALSASSQSVDSALSISAPAIMRGPTSTQSTSSSSASSTVVAISAEPPLDADEYEDLANFDQFRRFLNSNNAQPQPPLQPHL